jgi:RRXRR protein
MQQFVPVVSRSGKPLMPTTNRKANRLIAKGRAIRRFDRGLFFIQLTDREDGYTQPIAVGIDPGSKKEAITVKSEAHTYLNIQADAVTWVSEAEATSTMMRRSRRGRKTPYRQMRSNRRQGKFKLPPSTRARWGWKLRLCVWLARLYPIEVYVVEDIQAVTKPGKQHWNRSFSPLGGGKQWFYQQLGQWGHVEVVPGYETAQARRDLGLKKSKQKLSDSFEAHCVDSWVLANRWVGGHVEPDNKAMLYIVPLRFHRRQLHRLQPEKGGIRKPYGGTASLGFKRGSWVRHPQHGVCYVGGTTGGTVSLHDLQTGRRIAKVKPATLQFLNRSSWRLRKEEQRLSPPR